MMLQILMFHRLGEGKHSNSPSIFEKHLAFIKKKYPVVLPGDCLETQKRNICLTCDDAMCDFYFYTFPLLKKYDLKALLAVPTRYIVEKTLLTQEERLAVPYYEAFEKDISQEKAPFCTWQELREMVESGHVEVASHSHDHINLLGENVNLDIELLFSKALLEKKLPQAVSTFVYPFGKISRDLDMRVKEEYQFSMRIGNCYNRSWHDKKILCRTSVDNMPSPQAPFSFFKTLGYGLKTLFH